MDAGRRTHYGTFYDATYGDLGRRPLLAVLGNCQAESWRLVLEDDDVATVRVPPVHEWTVDDLGPLRALLARVDLLLTQPVRAGYRGLPVGTDELAPLLRPDARLALVAPVRYAARSPHHVLVHPPGLADPDPPVVAYHDVRTATRAAWAATGRAAPDAPPLTRDLVLAAVHGSVAAVREREERYGAVPLADLLEPPARPQMRTVNHPGTSFFAAGALRLREALGLEARPTRVTRPLLDAVHAPVEPATSGVSVDEPARATWRVGGQDVDPDEVERAHLAFYRQRPDVLAAVLHRSAGLAEQLGLPRPA
ncbi:WcbI family polysaccharide biosynthesis putative acetyltransferase [Lapillicoccus jejuensis]|uniref:Polysaccharide biosynthesis enzyme WcbI domain-containing protein n=1 Tax=Lapillicoccus jejuensis TaxID=402171 RepID=A0A542E4D8_9MICO|nr:WcbI family polysaccharide biosynthesis putative acetyltransferase [Lapillicoccus jejuensis]TQJ10212.1 hypothetical protein FB458_3331 [Lapillicoccus jejuensis]